MNNSRDYSESDVINKLNCLPKCTTESLKLVHRWTTSYYERYTICLLIQQKIGFECCYRNTSGINLFFRETSLEVYQQEFLYGANNFIADVGGYLGLLLGVSIFSFYQVLVSTFEKLLGKSKNKKTGSLSKIHIVS